MRTGYVTKPTMRSTTERRSSSITASSPKSRHKISRYIHCVIKWKIEDKLVI